jgi:flagellar capping protein FliD
MKLKELLKLEPTKQEKVYLQKHKDVVARVREEEKVQEKIKERAKVKDLFCMGIKTKLAKGPNPMSMRKKLVNDSSKTIKKRRLRKGKRSRELCQQKKAEEESK